MIHSFTGPGTSGFLGQWMPSTPAPNYIPPAISGIVAGSASVVGLAGISQAFGQGFGEGIVDSYLGQGTSDGGDSGTGSAGSIGDTVAGFMGGGTTDMLAPLALVGAGLLLILMGE